MTTAGFARIAGLGPRAVIVQEDGYLQPALGANLTRFLAGSERNRARSPASLGKTVHQ